MMRSLEDNFFLGKQPTPTPVAHTSFMSTLGERLREAREEAGLTQKQVAKASGMSQRAISMLERGNTESSRRVVDIASAVRVNPDWLQTGRGPKAPARWTELVDLSSLPPGVREDAKRLFASVVNGDLPFDRFRAAVVALIGDNLNR